MPPQWYEKMGTIETYDQDQSALGRINAWGFAMNVAKDRPVLGGGFHAFSADQFRRYAPNPDDVHDAHSIYFQVLGEQGYVGLGLFLLLSILTLALGSRIMRLTRDREDLKWAHDLAAMLQVSFAGFGVGGAFLGLAYFDLPYQLMAIMILTYSIVRAELQDARVTVPVETWMSATASGAATRAAQ
jgi:probable O-glycosylation ligase (exosortase A-associated)